MKRGSERGRGMGGERDGMWKGRFSSGESTFTHKVEGKRLQPEVLKKTTA